jgi:hypothetical protein
MGGRGLHAPARSPSPSAGSESIAAPVRQAAGLGLQGVEHVLGQMPPLPRRRISSYCSMAVPGVRPALAWGSARVRAGRDLGVVMVALAAQHGRGAVMARECRGRDQQRVELAAQGVVVTARAVEKGRALGRGQLHGGLEQCLQLAVTLAIDGARGGDFGRRHVQPLCPQTGAAVAYRAFRTLSRPYTARRTRILVRMWQYLAA